MSEELATGMHRFEALLRGTGDSTWDQPLLEHPDWLVAPTLGAVVAGWLLVVPRRRALNFRDWAEIEGTPPEAVLASVRDHLGLAADEVIWFEHGPRIVNTAVGCGVDHAHLHMVVRPEFTFSSFEKTATELSSFGWRSHDAGSAYSIIDSDLSYMIAGCGGRAIVAKSVETLGSQFLRRAVAALVGKAETWDYRRFPQPENVSQTVAIFRSLENVSRRSG